MKTVCLPRPVFVSFYKSQRKETPYIADRYAGDRYTAPFYGYWNTGMHFTTFIINAVTFAKIKSSLDQRHELERALKESREQLRQAANVTPLCPQEHARADRKEGQKPALR